MSIVIAKIDKEIEKLRAKWKQTRDKDLRKVIEAQAQSLNNARDLHLKNAK